MGAGRAGGRPLAPDAVGLGRTGWAGTATSRGQPPGTGVPDMVLLLPQDEPSGDGVLPPALSPQPPAFHPLLAVDLPVYVLQVRGPTKLVPEVDSPWASGHVATVFSGGAVRV